MTVWQFLSFAMKNHGRKMAFEDITYELLIAKVEKLAERYKDIHGPAIINYKDKKEQAIHILAVLCSGNTVISLSDEYGSKHIQAVEQAIRSTNIPSDVAICAFSSGTTDTPKGILLSHKAIISNIKAISKVFNIKNKKLLIVRPLCHMSAITAELLCSLYCGATVLFYNGAFDPKAMVDCINEKNITTLCTTPTVMHHCLRRNIASSCIEQICLSGEILSPERALSFAEAMPNVEFYNGYGLSEHCPRVSMLTPHEFRLYPGSVGKPLDGVQVKQSENGELLVSSDSVMMGYLGRPVLTQETLDGGWLHTGDIASMDGEYIYIKGRMDDMIIRAGVNIFPQDIRRTLLKMDGVQECIVQGVPDKNFTSAISVTVYGAVDRQQVREYAVKNLPPYMVPSFIKVEKEVPIGNGGKLKPNVRLGHLYSKYKKETFCSNAEDNISRDK